MRGVVKLWAVLGREEGEEGDGDDGVFYSGGGEDSVKMKEEVWGWGGGKGRVGSTFFSLHADARALEFQVIGGDCGGRSQN